MTLSAQLLVFAGLGVAMFITGMLWPRHKGHSNAPKEDHSAQLTLPIVTVQLHDAGTEPEHEAVAVGVGH